MVRWGKDVTGKLEAAEVVEIKEFTLAEVLGNIEEFTWSDALYLPTDEVWGADTRGVVLDPDDVEEDEDDLPQYAKEHGLIYALSIQDMKAIAENVKCQKRDYTMEDLLLACLYYYDHDAFMDLI